MTNFEIIENKLKKFISKYYRNELIRGLILFLAIGLLYFLFTVIVEHFLWLSSTGRMILFILFVAVELALIFKFIIIPLARLYKLFSGIDFTKASEMIGNHFPEVSDKLINVLQLREKGGDNELTWASINQKSEELKPIPFSLAIDFKKNISYLKYLAIPVLIFGVLYLSGNNQVITQSATRVADFNTDYVPPAPFAFQVMNADLETLQQRDFKLDVLVSGEKLPENVSINFQGKSFYLREQKPGVYSFTFNRPLESLEFYLQGNEVRSKNYQLKVGAVPNINDFSLSMQYPKHTGKRDEVIKSTGNATVPQGTNILWTLNTTHTSRVDFKEGSDKFPFEKMRDSFAFAKAVLQPTKYSIATSNENVTDFEELAFTIEVIKDEYPELDVEVKKDSIDLKTMYFKGQAVDDYGIKKIDLVYYKVTESQRKNRLPISKNKGTFDQFFQTFPGSIQLEGGHTYEFYFEVTDNDAVNNFKSVRSSTFSYNKLDQSKEEDQLFEKQKQSVSNIENALSEQEEQGKKLEELAKEQLEKKNRGYNDKKKLENALKNQEKQERNMRQQMERMKDNLEKYDAQKDPEKEELKKRMESSMEEMKKNEELLKELQKYQDKLSKEELKEKLEESRKKSKQQKRTLEQLLELTKRYYVEQKYEQLGKKLNKLADKQEQQSKKNAEENKKQDQDELNEEYKDWEKELKELEEENQSLKKEIDLDFEPEDSEEIKEEQQQSSEDLEKQQTQEASKKQKSAAEKMKKQAQKMASQMQTQSAEGAKEDAAMLRQILDNLIVLSVEQEGLLEETKEITKSSPNFGKKLRVQKDLEKAFKHVDDSLFALASRNPKVGQEINKEITDVYYYMDKALEQMGEFEMQQGSISQQFILKSANTLADMLSSSLDQMNNEINMSGAGMGSPKPGEGQGSGFQLSDIIKKQESLSGEGKKPGKGDKPGEGEQGQQPGSSGAQGSQGEGGKFGDGQDGKEGTNGQQGQEGENGESGSDGKGGQGGSGSGTGEEGEPSYKESEEESERIYKIYKEQQELRNQLEDMIRKEGLEGKVGNIVDRMKDVERRLIDQGYDRDVEKRMMQVIHELLKLKDAGLFQGKEDQRESERGNDRFVNPNRKLKTDPANYFNSKEVLNRQVLPLQPDFKNRVKEYFKSND